MPHIPDRHADHDLTLVAALATRDADPAEQAAADELVASCTDCAELLADLRSLATATAELPAPRRRRDYRLTAEQAARLRPTGLRRVFAAFGSARFAFAAPLGTAMATLGLVGLLVAAIPGPLAMGTAGGEDGGAVRQLDTAGEQPAAEGIPGYGYAAPLTGGQSGDPTPGTQVPSDVLAAEAARQRGADEMLVILGGATLLLGLGLLGLRWSSRRLA